MKTIKTKHKENLTMDNDNKIPKQRTHQNQQKQKRTGRVFGFINFVMSPAVEVWVNLPRFQTQGTKQNQQKRTRTGRVSVSIDFVMFGVWVNLRPAESGSIYVPPSLGKNMFICIIIYSDIVIHVFLRVWVNLRPAESG